MARAGTHLNVYFSHGTHNSLTNYKGVRVIIFEKIKPEAIIPKRATDGAAGFDLFAIKDSGVIKAGWRATIPTGIRCAIPNGWCGKIEPRSGLALSSGIEKMAGLIDSDYRGEIVVILINHGKQAVNFKAGDRVAQMTVIPIMTSSCEGEVSETWRGENGFGSTGR